MQGRNQIFSHGWNTETSRRLHPPLGQVEFDSRAAFV